MSIAIGTFIELDGNYLQNFFQGETVSWQGQGYLFAGFGYSGSSVDLEGGNIESQLIFSLDELSLGLAKNAADRRSIAVIRTVWLDPDTLVPKSNYMEDTFMVTGFEHDSSRLGLRLSSPLDAISADVPRRRLTETLVGALPSTGQVQLL
jgi:hypothetical protein